MTIKEIIQSQYLACLQMLENAIRGCPERTWKDPVQRNKFWHIAYHCLFYTHLYLQSSEGDFKPWEKHREEVISLSEETEEAGNRDEPYGKEDILEYLDFCQKQVKRVLPKLDLESQESGFYWLPFTKLELQLYNIRHIQHHTGELYERLGTEAGMDLDWVGMVKV